jgi:HSP20 family molecular chaperone IbpA
LAPQARHWRLVPSPLDASGFLVNHPHPGPEHNESFSFGAQHFNLNFGTNAESEAFARAIRALKDGLRGLYPFGPELRMIRAVDGKNRTGRLIGRPEGSGKRLKGASKMVRMTALTSPLLLGFDDLERALDRVSKTGTEGYPPYNIERIAANGGDPEKLRITLAVAGFAQDQIEVTVEENQLTIRGRQQEDKTREYLHRGIAARQFQRGFLLADGMQVLSAGLAQGLLSVDLVRPQPERLVRTIKIVARD